MACGPDFRVNVYAACIVNEVRFHNQNRDNRRSSQNSGVTVAGDNDGQEVNFYGVLYDVVELNYMPKCKWFDTNAKKKRIHQDNYHFTCINASKLWFENDPFILAIQGKQVFYVEDYDSIRDWKVV